MKLGTDDTTEKFSLFCEVWNQSLSRVAFVGHELDFEADWCGLGIIWYGCMVWSYMDLVWYGIIWCGMKWYMVWYGLGIMESILWTWYGFGIIWYMVWMVWYGLIWTWYGMV